MRRRISRWGVQCILLFLVAFSLLPIYLMFSTAVKPAAIIMERTLSQWFPISPTLQNFKDLIVKTSVSRWLFNSFLVTGSATISNVFLSAMAGYAFAKKDFPGKTLFFWMFISLLMLPYQVTIIPRFILMRKLHLIDTYPALIGVDMVMAIGVFLSRQFMQSLPSELIDAAKIDGCGEFRVFWRIILPLSKPVLALVAVFTFVGNWNAFFWPLIIINSEEMKTIQIGIAAFRATHELRNYGLEMAGASFAAVPTIIIFLLFQKYFIKGITMGAVKG